MKVAFTGRPGALLQRPVRATAIRMEAASADAHRRSPRARAMATIASLDTLIGAHPEALADYYATGSPADPSAIGTGHGRILALESLASTHAATRPLIVALARHLSPWSGKTFESGGTAGANLVFGKRLARFHGEVAPSLLDGAPTLLMRHDGLGNPWPLRNMVDELRQIGPGVAIGPLLWPSVSRAVKPILWWGLSTER